MDGPDIQHQFLIGAMAVAATTFVHGVFVAAAAAVLRAAKPNAHGLVRFFRDTFALVILALWLITAHFTEIAVWAGVYIKLGIFDGWEPSLYFAAASFTTLGFGDVLLPIEWRLLSGATAASGFLLFGLSTAFMFEAARQLHLGGEKNNHHHH